MSKAKFLALALCCCAFGYARSQQLNMDDLYTDGLLNGKAWKILDSVNKTVFVQGIRGGMALAAREAQSTGVANDERFRQRLFTLRKV